MEAKELFRKLENDFMIPAIENEGWVNDMAAFQDLVSDQFKTRSIGLVCDFAERITVTVGDNRDTGNGLYLAAILTLVGASYGVFDVFKSIQERYKPEKTKRIPKIIPRRLKKQGK